VALTDLDSCPSRGCNECNHDDYDDGADPLTVSVAAPVPFFPTYYQIYSIFSSKNRKHIHFSKGKRPPNKNCSKKSYVYRNIILPEYMLYGGEDHQYRPDENKECPQILVFTRDEEDRWIHP
jgi:hypothetical protein